MNENSDIEVPILSLDFKPEYQVGGMSERSGFTSVGKLFHCPINFSSC